MNFQLSTYAMFNPTKHQFEAIAAIILLVVIALALLLSSCNVTRTVTTTAQHYVSGDTTTTIITRTVESYDGKVDASKLLQAGQAASGL